MKKKKPILSLVLLCVVLVAIAMASAKSMAADENKFSLYDTSSALTKYFNEMMEPSESDGVKGIAPALNLRTGNAGAFLGYGEQGILATIETNASNTFTYGMVSNVPTTDANTTNAILQYCRFGYVLGELGLDESAAGSPISFITLIGGALIALSYAFCSCIPALFSAVISILKFLNPFQFFSLSKSTQLMGMDGAGMSDNSIAILVSGWYEALSNLAWQVLIPIFLVFLIVSIFLVKKANKMQKIKRFVTRIVFIVIGIPILGSLYTASLDAMSDLTSGDNQAATKVVAATFFDYEAWASNMRMAIPSTVNISYTTKNAENSVGAKPTGYSFLSTRDMCYEINKASGTISIDGNSPYVIGSGSLNENAVNWNNTKPKEEDSNGSQGFINTDVYKLIWRYAKGEDYTASMFESKSNAYLAKQSKDKDISKHVWSMFENSYESDSYDESKYEDRFKDMTLWGGYNIFANGGIHLEPGSEAKTWKFIDMGEKNNATVNDVQGLSTMSLYNYLNTSFSDESAKTFSSKKSTSSFVRDAHKSVNIVGGSIMSFLYWLNCLVLLSCFAVIGLFYAFGIIFKNLKRGIHLITSVPFAILGSIRAIAKVIAFSIAMIVEIIAVIFLYSLVTQLLLDLNYMIEAPFAKALGGSVASIDILLPVLSIVSTVIYVIFTIQAIRFRKTLVKALDEATSDIINKFLDVNGVGGGDNPGFMKQAANAVASGAGMAAGQKIMNGAGQKLAGKNNPNGTAPKTVNESSNSSTETKGAKGSDTVQVGGQNQPRLTASPDGIEKNGGDPKGLPDGGGAGFDGDGSKSNKEQANKTIADGLKAAKDLGSMPKVNKSNISGKDVSGVAKGKLTNSGSDRQKAMKNTAMGATRLGTSVASGNPIGAVKGTKQMTDGADGLKSSKSLPKQQTNTKPAEISASATGSIQKPILKKNK